MSVTREETPRLFTSNESTSSRSSKAFILRKKMEAEKLALEVKLAEQKFADEIECLRAERQHRAKILELRKKAEELRLECEFEDAIAMEDLCRHLKFGTPVHGFALQGHVVKNLSIGIYASCKHLCLFESHCVSFNLGPPIKDRMVCELSDSDSTKHPEDLKPRGGFVYRGTRNACSSNPCPHNATCLNGFTDERYLCECQAGYTGRQCEKENWKKINDVPVCFGARDDTYGTFIIKENGLVYTFKLVHRSGSLSCSADASSSYWGCDHDNHEDKRLVTVITYSNETALLLADYLEYSVGCGYKYYSYEIVGIGVNSHELVFNKLPTPLPVSIGQEFQIWYGQDLRDCSESNNGGQTCADVYAWYA